MRRLLDFLSFLVLFCFWCWKTRKSHVAGDQAKKQKKQQKEKREKLRISDKAPVIYLLLNRISTDILSQSIYLFIPLPTN